MFILSLWLDMTCVYKEARQATEEKVIYLKL